MLGDLGSLASAVIYQAWADAGAGIVRGTRRAENDRERHEAVRFLTADHGPWAQSRQHWAEIAGKRSSPVKFVKDADAGVLYVNADMIARHGQARCRQIAAEQGASTMRAFRSIEDLPQPMQQAHAQAMADRSNLIGDQ